MAISMRGDLLRIESMSGKWRFDVPYYFMPLLFTEFTVKNAALTQFMAISTGAAKDKSEAGREDLMCKVGDGVVHGCTYTAHSVSLAAANKTLEILDETDALKTIETYGQSLQTGLSKILSAKSIAHCFVGHPSMMGLFFSEEAPTDYRDWVNANYDFYDSLAPELHELGSLVEPDSREPWFISEAHDVKCLEQTLDKFAQAVEITMQKLPAEKSTIKTA